MGKIVEFVKDNIGLVIMVAIVSFILLFFGVGKNMFNSAMGDVTDTQQQISSGKYAKYDSTSVNGSEVINAIKNNASATCKVKVVTKAASTIEYILSTGYSITDPTQAAYIEPTEQFSSVLVKSTNNAVTGIIFTQK